MKTFVRAAASLALAISAILGGSLSASAAPTPAPTSSPGNSTPTYVEYAGASTESSESGHVFPGKFPSHVRIDCSAGPCVVTLLTIDDRADHAGFIDMSQGQRLVLVDGKGTFAMPAFGSVCGAFWIGHGTLTLTATATGFVGVRTSEQPENVNCPDGETVIGAFTVKSVSTLTGGNPCVLDSSCPTPKPTTTATPAPAPHIAPQRPRTSPHQAR